TIGHRDELLQNSLVARDFNPIKYPDLTEERPIVGKIRYKDAGAPGIAWQDEENSIHVAFSEPRRAITPGQAVVLYEGDDVLGGAWIDSVIDSVMQSVVESERQATALELSVTTTSGVSSE
ncbi:MAG: hypothetical protein O6942_04240, partial [Bacteroidetes bacterium]|nr:hypothetical protein [Bacteroidota bacterium]